MPVWRLVPGAVEMGSYVLLMEAGVMPWKLNRYEGMVIEMIYMDRCGRLTQRKIRVRSVRDDAVLAYCLEQRALRLFRLDRILAVHPLRGGRTGS